VLGAEIPVFKNREKSLRDILLQSKNHGDKIYIVCEQQRISYAEHLKLVQFVAHNLQVKYGIQKGDRVAILSDNYPEWIITFWATVSIGGIVVALNGWWSKPEILSGLELTQPKVLIADQKCFSRIAGEDTLPPCIVINENYRQVLFSGSAENLPPTDIYEDDPALILFTSGTTGKAKGATITHRNLLYFIASGTVSYFRNYMTKEKRKARGEVFEDRVVSMDSGLFCAPLFHLSGLFSGAISSFYGGLKTVWTPGRFDPEKILQIIQDEKIVVWSPLGNMTSRVVKHPNFKNYDVSSVSFVGSGGAPTSKETQELLLKSFPNINGSMLAVGYGLTESGGTATLNWNEFLKLYPGSSGRPFPGLELEIHDENGVPMPPDTVGNICIRGACVMKEYWNNPRATAETITKDRWLITGDIGSMNKDGFLFINSRARDLILRNAENIYPVEIEHCIERIPEVHEVAVVGIDHPEWGQEVKAYVVPVDGRELSITALEKFCKENLAAFKVPTAWEIRKSSMPRNASGKIIKAALLDETQYNLNPH